jgi:hypothetical protein
VTDYFEELGENIADEVATGMPLELAANLYGVSRAAAYNWMTWGREGKEPWTRFVEQIERAEAEFVQTEMKAIREAKGGPGADPFANHQWLLERRARKHFGAPKQEVEHTGAVVSVQVEGIANMDTGKMLEVLAAFDKRGAE